MTSIILQCGMCKNEADWKFTDEDMKKGSSGYYVCNKFPKGIPEYIEEGKGKCPKFDPMEGFE